MDKKRIDLMNLFNGMQKQMILQLTTNRENIIHPGEKGNATELCWIDLLRAYLPKRYHISKAFVVDSTGGISEQMDVVIYDRQYSPFIFNQNGVFYVPAESVYAVFEIRQDLEKENIEYASKKAASVRSLYRTSGSIPFAGGTYGPKPLHNIVAGIMTLGNTWTPPFGDSFTNIIKDLEKEHRLEIGVSLQYGSFIVEYNSIPSIKINERDPLLSFILNLLILLQKIATVPLIEIKKYYPEL